MDLKDFLKPTKGKIVITVVLFILYLYQLFELIVYADAPVMPRYSRVLGSIVKFLLLPITPLVTIIDRLIPSTGFAFLSFLVIIILYWYLISAITVFLYHKINK